MEAGVEIQGRGYRRLKVYLEAEQLAADVLRITEKYPKNEVFGAAAQSRSAALSVVSNIAEGYRRFSRREFIRFLKIAYGSCGELEAQLSVASKAGWIEKADYETLAIRQDIVSRWLYRLIESISRKLD